MWVKFPALPLVLWNEEMLKAIGQALGTFKAIDGKSPTKRMKAVTRVCVKLNLIEGLLDNIEIVARRWTYDQTLDHVSIPFRCSLCHLYGHLKDTCLTDGGKVWVYEETRETPFLYG
jgi:hypothetical protein